MALTGVVLIVGVVIILNDLVGNPALTDLSDTHFSVMSRRLRTFPFHKLKIPLVVFQVCVLCTHVGDITDSRLPGVYLHM